MNHTNNKEFSDFLKKIDLEKIKTYFVKIIVLTADEVPIRAIEGRISAGSINIDGNSAVRRTCNLTFLATEKDNNDLTNIENLLSINKKIKIEIGLENNIDNNYNKIIWFKQGIFIINQCSINHNVNGITITLSCKDKMCLLNGECGGGLPASVVFDSYNQINLDGSVTEISNPIYHIIETLVINYGYEQPQKVFINDLPLEIKQIVRWTGSEPLFYNKNTDIYSLNSDIVKDDSINWSTYNYNDDIGYAFVDFVYPKELVSGVGENVCSILDKIKNQLGNYEYFYDIEGNFIFQEVKNYLNNSYNPLANYKDQDGKVMLDNNLIMLNNENYYVDYNKDEKIIYNFTEGNGLISSYSNSISYLNVKNDFHIWGKNNDNKVIHYHVAIKNKPSLNKHQVVFIKNVKGDLTGKIRLPKIEDDGVIKDEVKNYTPSDWRAELYIQGLEAQRAGKRPDIYQQELLDLFDNIYDFTAINENGTYGKFKTDMIKAPNNLNYFIDFLEPTSELSNYSIDSLGPKIYSYQQDTINKIFEPSVPDVIILNINDQGEKRQKDMEKCEQEGQPFSNVDNNIYSKIVMNTTGYSAANTARELLYQYTDYSSSINIQSIPIYYLDVNRRITVNDKVSNIYGDYIIKSISLPLDAKSNMTISATKALERI